jgi:hypothetical protein
MKRVITGVVLALLSSSTWAFAEKTNNDMTKDCLTINGYDYSLPARERVNTFDWTAAAYCTAGFQQEQHKKRLAELTEFIKENPWYKGPNWRWKLRAEYTCRIVNNTDTGPIEVCSKPYYIN